MMKSGQRELHEDVLYYNILARLPCRSLARFATVCKAWHKLITHDAAFAALQAQSPSSASAALARFDDGRLEVLGAAAAAAAVAPPDPSFSFLPIRADQRLGLCLCLCACTNGLLCLTMVEPEEAPAAPGPGAWSRAFFVTNPATGRREFHTIRYPGTRGVAGLAYDPAAAAGYDLVVAYPQTESGDRIGFLRYSSRDAGAAGWRASRTTVPVRFDHLYALKTAYAGGRLHWLTHRGTVVWHDVAADTSGVVAPPACQGRFVSGGRLSLYGNLDLGAWRGKIRLASATSGGLDVWELAHHGRGGASSPARWELVHCRAWSQIRDSMKPDGCFLWSVVPAGMDPNGNESLGLAVRTARAIVVKGKEVHVWRRELVCYDLGTGATATVAKLCGKEVHDSFGTVFCYHSTIAALPRLDM